MLFRNDDIAVDSDLDQLRKIQAVFEKHNLREVYSIMAYGGGIYSDYTHEMPLEELEKRLGDKLLETNPAVVAFLKESLARGHKISMHGWQHTRVTDYPDVQDRIAKAKQYLEGLLDAQIEYFVPPFNHYNQRVLEACRNLGLPVSIGGGQLEKLVDEDRFENHQMYWYHFWRLDEERLDAWLTHFLKTNQ